jgi:REP element-mobilizing transposase RayT
MKLFKNKYRIDSTRLKSWDYGSDGYYFITICTKGRKHFFGKIERQHMHLSAIGQLAEIFLNEIKTQFSYARMDEYVVMPDHIHCIITIDNPSRRDAIHRISQNTEHQHTEQRETYDQHTEEKQTEDQHIEDHQTEAHQTEQQTEQNQLEIKELKNTKKMLIVNEIKMDKGGFTKEQNPMLHDNVSKIVRWYKGRTTFESRKLGLDFAWQPLFWDHVIQNERALNNIRDYIQNNPKKWEKDKQNNPGLKM